MIKENKEVALKSIFQVSKHRYFIQHYMDSYRFNFNEKIQKDFGLIEEDRANDYTEKINLDLPELSSPEEAKFDPKQSLLSKDESLAL